VDLGTRNRQQYLDYIASLNDRRFDELGRFVAADAVHNGRALGVLGYLAMLEDDVATIPDLFFDVVHLAVDGDLVAARIRFRITPVAAFRGFAPTGATVEFVEHVFYRFVDDRIAEVFSVIDDDALRRQLPPVGE
jgi:predicted ester cyclase